MIIPSDDDNDNGDIAMTDAPVIQKDESSSFLEKVRRDKELKARMVQAATPVPAASSNMSMNAYRASRGLPPLQSSRLSTALPAKIPASVKPSNAGTSNLFINRRKPVVSVSEVITIY